jgi:signal transduction histidine kinase
MPLSRTNECRRARSWPQLLLRVGWGVINAFWLGAADGAPPELIPAPAVGLVEAGLPNFVVLGPEALGLAAAPAGFVRLPDGRHVAFAQHQVAIGDGARWEVFEQDAADSSGVVESLVVDGEGRLFASMGDAVGELVLGDNNRWSRRQVAAFASTPSNQHPGFAQAVLAAGTWYWYGNSGTIAAWRGDAGLVPVGTVNAISSIFALGGRAFVSEASSGRLFAIAGEQLLPVGNEHTNTDDAITGTAPYAGDRLLVATYGRGLKVFDGESFTPLPLAAPLDGAWHITDLRALAGGCYAAAVEDFGVVFFERSGRIVQTLGSEVDHRLARVRRLYPAIEGEVWAVLSAGVARIEFPSPVSRLEPLVAKGFSFAQPFRHRGRLWLRTDRTAQRGVYDGTGRLLRFVPDTPVGFNVHSMLADPHEDLLFAGTRGGLFVHRNDSWELVLPGIAYMRLFNPFPGQRRWFYAASGEIGWVRAEGDRFVAERHPAPECGTTYGGVCGPDGTVWIEMGSGKCGRVDLSGPVPKFQLLGTEQGLDNSWVQLARFGDEVRVVVAGRLMRHDAAVGRFVYDTDFEQRFPGLVPAVSGRPSPDAAGRIWITAKDTVFRFDPAVEPPRRLAALNLPGPGPYYYFPQADGVMWMHRNNYLVRHDPAMTVPPPPPLRALITRVQLTADNLFLAPVGRRIAPVRYASNSLAFQFVAPGAPLGAPVEFETRLEGGNQAWVPAGSGGAASYPRLKEGDYVLHVRPRYGERLGEEDWLAFTVLPPWQRTTVAYVSYGFAVVVLAALLAWAGAYLEKREKHRLARLVDERTVALQTANRRLAEQHDEATRRAVALQASEERFRHLSAELEERVRARTDELERQVVDSARLNRALQQSQDELGGFAARLQESNARLITANHELEAFSYSVSHDLRAPLRNISGFIELLLRRLQGKVDAECDRQLGIVVVEARRMGLLIDDLLQFARIGRVELQQQTVDLAALVDEFRGGLGDAISERAIEWVVGPLPRVRGDRGLLRQVVVNLVGNAVKFTGRQTQVRIEIGCSDAGQSSDRATFFVRDNGAGFDPKYSDKLFGVFQRLHSAKDFEGTGIGLANVKRVIDRHGGRVWAEGRLGEGATFYFTLPLAPPKV